MKNTGPPLETLLTHLAECPAEFLREPLDGGKQSLSATAVVHDLLIALGHPELTERDLLPITRNSDVNRSRLILIACWLLHHAWFRQQQKFGKPAAALLFTGLNELAAIVEADQFIHDADHREELVRFCLAALNLRPAGEIEAQSRDRLSTLDSVERIRLTKAAEQQRERARQVLEAMKKKSAEAAAAKASRE